MIETEFGYHIIKLTELKPVEVTPLAEVRDEIEAQLLTEKATDEFFALQSEMANLAFEVPDTLEDVAGAVTGKVKETGLVTVSYTHMKLPTKREVSHQVYAATKTKKQEVDTR